MSLPVNPPRELFGEERQTRNVRFFYQGENVSAERLLDYRQRAVAQIRNGASVADRDLDRVLLD